VDPDCRSPLHNAAGDAHITRLLDGRTNQSSYSNADGSTKGLGPMEMDLSRNHPKSPWRTSHLVGRATPEGCRRWMLCRVGP